MGKDFEFKPAADLDLTFKERLNSVSRERSVFSLIYSWVWWTFTSALMKLYFRFKVVGREHLPKDLPFVLIGNHSSHLDVISLMLAVPMRKRDQVFPLAAQDHFFKRTSKAAFTAYAINALPLSRQGGGREAMLLLRERLQSQRCGIVLFPEGTRSRDGQMQAFKAGVGLLAAGTNIPVVPCYIDGAFAAFPANVSFPRPRAVRLVIGKPVTFEGFANDKDGCQAVAAQLESLVRSLA